MSIYTSTRVLPYVYKLVHKETGQFYFGYREKNVRLNLASSEDLGIHYFSSSRHVAELCFDNFDYEIIAEFYHGEDAFWFEQGLIESCAKDKNILNKRYYRHGSKLFRRIGPHSEETKRKISEKWKDPGRRVKRIEKMRSRVMTEETKHKISKSHQGKPLSEAHKSAVSAGLKGRTLSDAHKRQIGTSRIGVARTEETKRKCRENNLGKKRSSETCANVAASQRKVWIIEKLDGEIFLCNNLKDWCKTNNIGYSSMLRTYTKNLYFKLHKIIGVN